MTCIEKITRSADTPRFTLWVFACIVGHRLQTISYNLSSRAPAKHTHTHTLHTVWGSTASGRDRRPETYSGGPGSVDCRRRHCRHVPPYFAGAVYIHLSIYWWIELHMFMSKYIHTLIHTHTCTHAYTHTYVRIYTYTYTHISHTHSRFVPVKLSHFVSPLSAYVLRV